MHRNVGAGRRRHADVGRPQRWRLTEASSTPGAARKAFSGVMQDAQLMPSIFSCSVFDS
jgi:hypothetical protein